METLAGAPLAVGVEAIRTLNKWLETREVAQAWYGRDWNTFCKTTTQGLRRAGKPKITKIFTIRRSQWNEVITASNWRAPDWHQPQYIRGQCCWLPLYRTLSQTVDGIDRFTTNTYDGLPFIGTAISLPAARVDLWGLVVMGYANGALLEMSRNSTDGGYRARLDARNLTLTVRQEGLNSSTVAHITVKATPSHERTCMSVLCWESLLGTGSSISLNQDDLLAWLQNFQNGPDEALVDGRWNSRIQNAIFDYYVTDDLKTKLEHAYCQCYDTWKAVAALRPQVRFISDNEEVFCENLLKSKVFMSDETYKPYCEELCSIQGVLDYSVNQWALVHEEHTQHQNLNGLLNSHRVLLSLHRLYILSQKIPKQLSTRGSGDMVLIA
ncbi:hypothetical protein AFCA_011246 [Aspergillus flavus]|nr:hypothetical protein AFCA_011246 [Aspergillus flavus]